MLADNKEPFSGHDDGVAIIERNGRQEEFDIITREPRERRIMISYECETHGCHDVIEYTDLWLIGNIDTDNEIIVCDRCKAEKHIRVKGILRVRQGGHVKED